jgi:N-acetyl-gamma-glutamyl-phosphate reductase
VIRTYRDSLNQRGRTGLNQDPVVTMQEPIDVESLEPTYVARYRDEELIEIATESPLPRHAAYRVGATIGGFSVRDADLRHIGVAVALDNLLKGAASQAVQNINLAYGFDHKDGLR